MGIIILFINLIRRKYFLIFFYLELHNNKLQHFFRLFTFIVICNTFYNIRLIILNNNNRIIHLVICRIILLLLLISLQNNQRLMLQCLHHKRKSSYLQQLEVLRSISHKYSRIFHWRNHNRLAILIV